MTEKLTRTEFNCDTGETTIHELTTEEIAEFQARAEAALEAQATAEAEAAQIEADRQAGIDHLKSLGLTDAMIAALIK